MLFELANFHWICAKINITSPSWKNKDIVLQDAEVLMEKLLPRLYMVIATSRDTAPIN